MSIISFKDRTEKDPINIRLEELIDVYNLTKEKEYLLEIMILYQAIIAKYEYLIEQEEDPAWKNFFGKGFCIVLSEFGYNQNVKDFFAKRMVENLYANDEDFNLEKYLHTIFNSPKELENKGIRKHIIDSIYGIDESLSGYLAVHPELLSSVEAKFYKIIKNWENYEEEHKVTFDKLLDVTYEFVKATDSKYTGLELAYYLRFVLGYEWPESFREFVDYGEGVSDEEYFEFIFSDKDLETQKHLLDYKKCIKEFVSEEKYPDAYIIKEAKLNKFNLKRNKKQQKQANN